MTFDKKGNIKTIEKYPNSQLQRERRPIWIKYLYASGRLSHYYGKDTTESWFKNGVLRSRSIEYKVGGTTYKKELDRYDRRHVQKRSLERSYPKIIYSEFDLAFKKKVTAREIVYHEKYFRNGRLNSRYGTPDSRYTTLTERNPVGSYRRDFSVPAEWKGRRIFITFDGVDAVFFLWVNSKKIGYSVNSRNAAEFDITDHVKQGNNVLVVEVCRFVSGSYFENLDMWRLSGIFRNVTLWSSPQQHIRDFLSGISCSR